MGQGVTGNGIGEKPATLTGTRQAQTATLAPVAFSRRAFLRAVAVGGGLAALSRCELAAARSALAQTFPDLKRHFIFEYYAWYGMHPVDHWDQDGRVPPIDLASNYMPRLGAYDSNSLKVMAQHAKWMRAAGAGAINVSWWGRDSSVDRLIPSLMDVMRDHDLRVAFHLEPYREHHAMYYAEDVEYLIRQYGDRRKWDAMLLLRDANGDSGPVFKSFRTILPATETDCHGQTSGVRDYAGDELWRAQTDRVRRTFAHDFQHVTLLADSLDIARTKAAGFDGIAIYDNYVAPSTWRGHATNCARENLLFAFNVNPGFDAIVRRDVERDSCYVAPSVQPEIPDSTDGVIARVRRYKDASERRIGESFAATVALQTDRELTNARRGFFLVYINSFNEWHEGHQFEPMKNRGDLTRAERAVGYRNPDEGDYRLEVLKRLLDKVLS
jgi:hypothetical protein